MGNKKFNIDVYCLCWNEAKIIPFVIQYWKRFARHVYVYDNGSDDGSLELLAQYPDWITVRHFGSDGFNDMVNKEIKNNCWKGSDADWVWVGDFDECLYSKDLEGFLSDLESKGVDGISPQCVNVVSYDFPVYNENKLCHEICGGGEWATNVNSHKMTLFKPSRFTDINYGVGAHFCRPSGEHKIVSLDNDIFFVHLCMLGVDYVVNKCKRNAKRLSDINKRCGLGIHYLRTEDEIRKDFDSKVIKAIE